MLKKHNSNVLVNESWNYVYDFETNGRLVFWKKWFCRISAFRGTYKGQF